MRQKAVFSLLFLIVMAFACAENDTAELQVELPMRFGFLEHTPLLEEKSSDSVSVSDGHILIDAISFEAESNGDTNSLDIEKNMEQIVKADLGEWQEADLSIKISSGKYQEMEIQIELYDSKTTPSVYFTGIFRNSKGRELPLIFDFRDDMEFNFQAEAADGNAITLNDEFSSYAAITFSIDSLFSGMSTELENARLKGNTLLIKKDFNGGIYEKLSNRLDEASGFSFEE